MSVEQAAQLSGLSRQWWYEAESGERKGHPVRVRPNSLAKALLAIGGDLAEVFATAAYDARPFLAEYERWRSARDVRAEVAPIPADTDADELRQLDADILGELQAIRTELQRLGDAQQKLVERLPVPPPPVAPSARPAKRAVRPATPASE